MQMLLNSTFFQKRSTKQTMKPKKVTPASKARDRIIRRAALEFKDGMYGKNIR